MKQSRHEKILELIKTHDIGTQEELLELLKDGGFDITQATVSRDIKELRLIKTLSKSGEYVYATGKPDEAASLSLKFDELFSDSVVRIDYVMNQIVVKCYTGLANAVCASFDMLHLDNVVGTIAGDDTMLIIMRDAESAAALFGKLRASLRG